MCYVCLFVFVCVHTRGTSRVNMQSQFGFIFSGIQTIYKSPWLTSNFNLWQREKGSEGNITRIAWSEEVHWHLANNGVIWKYIVEKAPWWGGFWKHLIQSVKRCLKKFIGRSALSFEEVSTLTSEVETAINSRPFTYVKDDQDGVSFTLCPSHLISGRSVTATPNSLRGRCKKRKGNGEGEKRKKRRKGKGAPAIKAGVFLFRPPFSQLIR